MSSAVRRLTHLTLLNFTRRPLTSGQLFTGIMPQTRAQTSTIISRTLASSGKYVVEHDEKNHKFVIKLDPDNSAFIDYEELNNKEVLLYHTEVPELYGGKGIGQILADVSCCDSAVAYFDPLLTNPFSCFSFRRHLATLTSPVRKWSSLVLTCKSWRKPVSPSKFLTLLR